MDCRWLSGKSSSGQDFNGLRSEVVIEENCELRKIFITFAQAVCNIRYYPEHLGLLDSAQRCNILSQLGFPLIKSKTQMAGVVL